MAMDELVASTSSSTTSKRPRDQDSSSWESPEAKRLREDLLFDILDGDDDEEIVADPASADSGDLADVMRSFEEEIAASVSPLSAGSSASSSSSSYEDYTDASDVQQQLGFLLEASDDELGLPPPAGEKQHQQEDDVAATSHEDSGVSRALAEATAGNYWGFQDPEEGVMMTLPVGVDEQQGWQGPAAMLDNLASFGDGPFGDDYGDVYLSWPSDLADFSLVA